MKRATPTKKAARATKEMKAKEVKAPVELQAVEAPVEEVKAPAKAPAKPPVKGKAPSKEVKAPAKPPKAPEKEAKAPAKDAKVEEPKKDAVVTLPETAKKVVPLAKMFPKEIEHPLMGKLTAAIGKYTSVAEIAKALDEGITIAIATYWTKRHIKQFSYKESFFVDTDLKNGFPNDLDIVQVVITCEHTPKLYAVSTYTEAMYHFFSKDFEELDEGLRVANGMEFQVYEVIPAVEAPVAPTETPVAPAPAK